MQATLEMFWDDGVSRYDNLPDDIGLSSARIAALSGAHAILRLSDGLCVEYISDNNEPVGYRTTIPKLLLEHDV